MTALALKRPVPRPDARETLVGLSFCGGGTAPMRPWAHAVPDHVELALLCYPGRESRFTEPFAPTWQALVGDAVRAISPVTGRPYTLLGHSMGAWVAFSVALRLAEDGCPAPQALVASGAEPPGTRRPRSLPLAAESGERLIAWMSEMGQLPGAVSADPELAELAIAQLRADLRVAHDYRHQAGAAIGSPIHVLFGADDPEVDPGAMLGWGDLTSAGCGIRKLPGHHFYTDEIWAALPAVHLKSRAMQEITDTKEIKTSG